MGRICAQKNGEKSMITNFKVGDEVTFKISQPDDPQLLKIVAIYESRNVVMLKGIDKPWRGGTGINNIEKADSSKPRPIRHEQKVKPKPKPKRTRTKRTRKREKPEDFWP